MLILVCLLNETACSPIEVPEAWVVKYLSQRHHGMGCKERKALAGCVVQVSSLQTLLGMLSCVYRLRCLLVADWACWRSEQSFEKLNVFANQLLSTLSALQLVALV
jgi:hypothetical protein